MSIRSNGAVASSPLADLRSGFFVFLIALPLCLGIAMASGFPPVAGVLTAIIGGVVVSFLGSARLTIKGPAAGLIVIALGAVQELGAGDPVAGYKRALAVGVAAAVIQISFALVRAATAGIMMSPSVVHGMLAAIGVIIISKQAHTVLGVVPHAKEPLELVAEIPRSLGQANPEIALLGLMALFILIVWPRLPFRLAKTLPAPVVVLLITVPLGGAFGLAGAHDYHLLARGYHVGPEYLVALPGSLLSAVTFPDFSVIASSVSIKYIVMFALVGTIESTLSVLAVDSMDPQKRVSKLNHDLLAVGIGNLACGLVGGLPMISEIVRSKANIDAGARGRWSNFFHGTFLLVFVALLPGLLGMIPLAALAAMLVYTGLRLASPSEFAHAKHLGRDQFALFLTTMVVTLATDLLVGVVVGLVLKVALHVARTPSIGRLFRPDLDVELRGDVLVVRISGAATFLALLALQRRLKTISPQVRQVVVDLSATTLVDHTFLFRLEAMSQEWANASLSYRGLEELEPSSHHHLASRRRIAA